MICKDIITFLQRATKDKRVLDIGALGNIEDKIGYAHSLHVKYAKEVHSIDINKEWVDKIIENGDKNIYYADITNNKDIDNIINKLGQFSIIIMIEVIEHIDNPGLALENIKRLLTDEGVIIITTPNASSIRWFVQLLKEGNFHSLNPEHVCWYDKQTLIQVLKKHKLYQNRFYYAGLPTEEEQDCIVDGEFREWMCKRLVMTISKLTRYEIDKRKMKLKKELKNANTN